MLRRFWTYQQERFPILLYAPLIAVFSSSTICLSALLRGAQTFPDAGVLVGGWISALLFFLLLRIADEFKDYEDDRRYRPYRPVPRGLVRLRELGMIALLALGVQLGVALAHSSALLPPLLMLWGYLGLMSKEFFIPGWLKAHPAIYLLSHMLIIPLIDLYLTAWDWGLAGVSPPGGLLWLVGMSFFNGIVLEVGRKIRAPADEEAGVETYSALWGRQAAVVAWLLPLSLTAICAICASRYLQTELLTGTLLSCSLLLAVVIGLSFVRAPLRGRASSIEHFSSLWTLLAYLSIGLLPALWRTL